MAVEGVTEISFLILSTMQMQVLHDLNRRSFLIIH